MLAVDKIFHNSRIHKLNHQQIFTRIPTTAIVTIRHNPSTKTKISSKVSITPGEEVVVVVIRAITLLTEAVKNRAIINMVTTDSKLFKVV